MTDLTSKALLVASIRNRLFASRDTVDEALNYAVVSIELLDNIDRASMYTVLHVVMNTIADKIDALPDSSAAALEPPPAEVLVNSDGLQVADYPATGAPLLSDQISDIVDQRIKFQLKGFDHQIRAVDDRLENWFGNNLDIIDERITEVVRNMSFTVEVD